MIDRRGYTDKQLVEMVAWHMERRIGGRVRAAELYDLGLLGLAVALNQWNGHGEFNPFAMERIRWAMIDGLRKLSRDAHNMAMAATELSADQYPRTPQEVYASSPEPAGAAEGAIDDIIDDAAGSLAVDYEAAAAVERDADRIRLRRAIADLPPPQDQILDRYYYQGETFDEVAKELEMPVATVFYQHAKGVRQLVRLFGEISVPAPGSSAPMAP